MRMEQMTADTVLLKLQNVTKTRNDWKVLNHVTAEVRENRIIGVIGDNGIGKSTLLKLMAGQRPDYPRRGGHLLYSFRKPLLRLDERRRLCKIL